MSAQTPFERAGEATREVLLGRPLGQEVDEEARPDNKYAQGKEGVATAYEWFLDLPPVVPLLVMWVAGVALLGTCALVLYGVGRVLVGMMEGSI